MKNRLKLISYMRSSVGISDAAFVLVHIISIDFG